MGKRMIFGRRLSIKAIFAVSLSFVSLIAQARPSSREVFEQLRQLPSAESRIEYFTRHYPFTPSEIKDVVASSNSLVGRAIALELKDGTLLMSTSERGPGLGFGVFWSKPALLGHVKETHLVKRPILMALEADQRVGVGVIVRNPDPTGFPVAYGYTTSPDMAVIEELKEVAVMRELSIMVEAVGPSGVDFSEKQGVQVSLSYIFNQGHPTLEGPRQMATAEVFVGARVVYADIEKTGFHRANLKLAYLDPQDPKSLIGEVRPLSFWSSEWQTQISIGKPIPGLTVRIPKRTFALPMSRASMSPGRSCPALF